MWASLTADLIVPALFVRLGLFFRSPGRSGREAGASPIQSTNRKQRYALARRAAHLKLTFADIIRNGHRSGGRRRTLSSRDAHSRAPRRYDIGNDRLYIILIHLSALNPSTRLRARISCAAAASEETKETTSRGHIYLNQFYLNCRFSRCAFVILLFLHAAFPGLASVALRRRSGRDARERRRMRNKN